MSTVFAESRITRDRAAAGTRPPSRIWWSKLTYSCSVDEWRANSVDCSRSWPPLPSLPSRAPQTVDHGRRCTRSCRTAFFESLSSTSSWWLENCCMDCSMRRMSWRAPSFLRPCQPSQAPEAEPQPAPSSLHSAHYSKNIRGSPVEGPIFRVQGFRADALELESPEMLTRRGVAGLISNGGPWRQTRRRLRPCSSPRQEECVKVRVNTDFVCTRQSL